MTVILSNGGLFNASILNETYRYKKTYTNDRPFTRFLLVTVFPIKKYNSQRVSILQIPFILSSDPVGF